MPTGTLYVLATPIGNLADMTKRGEEILASADLVVGEDTRVTRGLLAKLGLPAKPCLALFKDKEMARSQEILGHLEEGKRVVLTSDAGTPAISDPGYRVVQLAQEGGHQVIPVPGASALTALYSASGFASSRFWFEGFLPRKGKERQERLLFLGTLEAPFVLYEAPHRMGSTLKDLCNHFPGGTLVLGRELTKLYEELLRGTPEEVMRAFSDREFRGEFVLALQNDAPRAVTPLPPLEGEVLRLLGLGLSPSMVAKTLYPLYGVSKKSVYQLCLESSHSGQ